MHAAAEEEEHAIFLVVFVFFRQQEPWWLSTGEAHDDSHVVHAGEFKADEHFNEAINAQHHEGDFPKPFALQPDFRDVRTNNLSWIARQS